jgi:hypothetical protein
VLRFNGTWYKIGRTGGVKSVNSRVGAVDLSLRDMDGVDPALNATPGNLLRGDGTAWRSVTPSAIRPYLVATWSSDLWYMTNIEFFEQIKFMDQWIITEVGGEFLNVHSASPFTKVQYISIPSSGWYYVSTFATHRMRKDDGQSVFTLVSSGGNRFPLQPFLPGILDQRRYRDNPDCDYGENSLCRNTMSIRRVVYLNGGYTLRTGVFFESTCCITEVWDYIGMTNVGGPATGLFIMKLY